MDNIFEKNIAGDFGGAIYSECDKLNFISSNNNRINYNSAGIMGGGIHSLNIIDLSGFEFKNNTISSVINNYSSNPAFIYLNTTLDKNIELNVGDYFPLTFTLYDEYGNIFKDVNKYFSFLILKLTLVKKEDDFKNSRRKRYYLKGNIGSFSEGKYFKNNIGIKSI